jgi:TfoX/Sxy family transcriptional regulator of competence genes
MEHKWKKSSPELGKLLEASMLGITSDRKMMFGSPVYMINRNMFAGVHEDSIFIRLSAADREEISGTFPEAKAFEPLKGRIMKEYITVPKALYGNKAAFRQWLNRAQAYAIELPTRAGKKGK